MSTRMNANRFKNYNVGYSNDYKIKQQKIQDERKQIVMYFENLKKAVC